MLLTAVLAAGRATRFGSGKLDADLRGRSLGLWALGRARQLGGPVIVVTGPQAPGFVSLATPAPTLVVNPDPARGMGSSIALAADSARQAGASQLLIMLADMPFVSPETLRRLCDAAPPGGAAGCRYGDDRAGPPACFSAAMFAALERLEGDQGARRLLGDPDRVVLVDAAADELRDVDTLADLAALNRL